jgi:outer membrane protein OmpA-like peptidoglycan-associated protein
VSHVAIAPELLRTCHIPTTSSYVAFDPQHPDAFDAAPLDAVATCLITGPLEGVSIDLVGHTCTGETSDDGTSLGERRADDVARYLAAKHVPQERLVVRSRGAQDATGGDPAKMAYDRRVDLTLGE